MVARNFFGPFLVKFRRLGGDEKFWGQMIVCQVLHDGPLARESHDLATNSHKLATNSRRTRATLVRTRDDLVRGSREDVRRSQLTRRNRATSRQVAAPRGSSRPPREVGNYCDERWGPLAGSFGPVRAVLPPDG